MHVDFSFCLVFIKELYFLWNRIIFFLEHKLLQVHLTWLHLVYGKILFYARHQLLMVSVEYYTI